MDRIQTSIATHFFREMDVLAITGQILGKASPINILSFGCSIGDELATLRVQFPNANIHGCDIDPFALEVAERSVGKMAHVFLSSEAEIIRRGPYDLVCAFSSLCIHPAPNVAILKEKFPFSRFEGLLDLLSNQMRPGALFAIRNSSYPFSRTRVARDFNTIRSYSIMQSGFVPMFNPNGNAALAVRGVHGAQIFDVRDVDGLDDWDFIDSIFQKRESTSAPREILERPLAPYVRPTTPLEPLAQWDRSNLDFLQDDDRTGLIEIKHSYQIFQSGTQPGAVFMEREIVRSAINGKDVISFGKQGWWT